MKKITIIIALMLLPLASFAQSNDFNSYYNDVYSTIASDVQRAAREAYAKDKARQAQMQQTQQAQTQMIQSSTQAAQQQALQDFNSRISSEGQIRMEHINNPDVYIDRSITNRRPSQNATNTNSTNRNSFQNQQRDLRNKPVHSENFNSRSLQSLNEARKGDFEKENKELTIDPNATVRLFDAPKLNDYPIGNADANNVQQYFDKSGAMMKDFLGNLKDLENILKTQFEQVSGFNLDEIKNTQPEKRTDKENQALADYEAYRVMEMEQMNRDIERQIDNSQEKKEIDAAILALDVYGNDEEGWLSQTNYEKLDIEALSNAGVSNEHQSILKVAEEINKCNETQSETGFHAELYYNEATDTYVISFRGTEGKDLNDIKTDAKIGINAGLGTNYEIKQYEMAMRIAEEINKIPKEERDKLNIEVVGHSLGGGLASVVGLEAGIETKTFNAAMVPDNFLKEKGLLDKVNNGDVQNVTAYHTSTDLLTNSQNKILGTSAIGNSVDIGDPATLWEETKAVVTGAAAGTIVGATGGTVAGAAVGGVVGAVTGDVVGTTAGSVVGKTAGTMGGTVGTGTGAVVGAVAGATVGTVVGAITGPVVGAAGVVMAEGHRMRFMVRSISNSNTEKKKAEWDNLRNAQYRLQKELRSAEIRRDF